MYPLSIEDLSIKQKTTGKKNLDFDDWFRRNLEEQQSYEEIWTQIGSKFGMLNGCLLSNSLARSWQGFFSPTRVTRAVMRLV